MVPPSRSRSLALPAAVHVPGLARPTSAGAWFELSAAKAQQRRVKDPPLIAVPPSAVLIKPGCSHENRTASAFKDQPWLAIPIECGASSSLAPYPERLQRRRISKLWSFGGQFQLGSALVVLRHGGGCLLR